MLLLWGHLQYPMPSPMHIAPPPPPRFELQSRYDWGHKDDFKKVVCQESGKGRSYDKGTMIENMPDLDPGDVPFKQWWGHPGQTHP